MRKNLRSACLLFLVFIFFIPGFVGMGSAEQAYDYTFNETKYINKWDSLSSPTSEYNIWGYPGKPYNFTTEYNRLLFSNNTTMVFYWDCRGNKSDYTPVPLSDENHHQCKNDTINLSHCTHTWNHTGIYYVSVGVFQDGNPINVSYWVPVYIRNNCTINVKEFSMLEDSDRSGCSSTYKVSILANSSENSENSHNSSIGSKYCGYVDNDYSFNVTLNATFKTDYLTREDERTVSETTTEIDWGDNRSDNSLSIDNNFTNSSNKSIHETYAVISAESFTHQWNKIGEKEINANGFYWDPLDGNRSSSNNNTTNILIIRDPKNFFPTSSIPISNNYIILGFFWKVVNFVIGIFSGILSNLQNWGIILSIIGLIIFYVTYTKNNVPIEVSIFEWKPFYLKSVNSFTGTLTFVAGMYLYFVFGRCPWDVPFVSSSDTLSNMYFGLLYYEYVHFDIPYLSILIGLLDVITLSLVINLIAIPFYRGELKIGKISIKRSSPIPVQPDIISSPVESKKNQKN